MRSRVGTVFGTKEHPRRVHVDKVRYSNDTATKIELEVEGEEFTNISFDTVGATDEIHVGVEVTTEDGEVLLVYWTYGHIEPFNFSE